MIMIPFAEDAGRKPKLEHQRTLIAAPIAAGCYEPAFPIVKPSPLSVLMR
jgi:hypothetical protein